MDSRDIGRYGTIHYMKRLLPDTPVVAFPVDDETVSFGRDPSCNIRLYYPEVSSLHCKIIIEDRKAFLSIHGTNGVIVDGCHVYPTSTAPTIVPLPNYSEFEIHSKRFRFTYPPKELRAALLATPARCDIPKRALRMSMIQSALVFSPRPSPDPQENLRVLQSPLKPFRASPATPQDEVVLVQGNHPKVVEEEKDLVICEDVDLEDDDDTPSFPLAPPPPPQTPRNRPTMSLHRAVLIRSAQRAILQAESKREEEEEEAEVEQFITTSLDVVEEDEVDLAPEDHVEESDSDDEEDSDEERESRSELAPSASWRKGLGVVQSIWPFRSTTPATSEEADKHYREDDRTSKQRTDSLGSFMTPQAPRNSSGAVKRYSTGNVGELRKVKVEQIWRVKDIVLSDLLEVKEEQEEKESHEQSAPAPVQDVKKKETLTEEQRQAIRERRKSALVTPDKFFAGRVPGSSRPSSVLTSPSKGTQLARLDEDSELPPLKPFVPVKTELVSDHSTPVERTEDTEQLLTKMKIQVEDAKRRKSDAITHGRLSIGGNASPEKSINRPRFSLIEPWTPQPPVSETVEEEDGQDENRDNDSAVGEPNNRGPPPTVSTPRMDGFREMLAGPSKAPSTPVFTGVRELFKQPTIMATPSYEGIDDMLQESDQHDIEVEESAGEVQGGSSHKEKKPKSQVPLAKKPAVRRGTRTRQLAGEVEDDSTPQDQPIGGSSKAETTAPAKPRVRLLRGKTASTSVPEPCTNATTSAVEEAPTTSSECDGDEVDKETVSEEGNSTTSKSGDVAAPARAAARRTRKVAVPASEPAAKTRGRAPTAKKQAETTIPAVKPSTRKGRTPKAAVKEEELAPSLHGETDNGTSDDELKIGPPAKKTTRLPTRRTNVNDTKLKTPAAQQSKPRAATTTKARTRTTAEKKSMAKEDTPTPEDVVDKENDEQKASKPASKARKTRKAAGEAEGKEAAPESEPPAIGIRRSARTRVKTG